jgi:endo-1,4-beta-xylanase
MTLSRRQFVTRSAALAALPALGTKRCVPRPATLQEAARAKGITYGSYTNWSGVDWRANEAAQTAYRSECGLLVLPVYAQLVHPDESIDDYTTPDIVANVAAANGQQLRGHPLLWEQVLPDWMENILADPSTTRSRALGLMVEQLTTSVDRYRSRVTSWDVVNEGIDAYTGDENGLKLTGWRRKIGPEYLDLAFRAARDADPESARSDTEPAASIGRRRSADHGLRRAIAPECAQQ